MNYGNYSRVLFESFPDYRKIVIIIFLIQNIKNLLLEVGFSELDMNRLVLEFKKI